MGVAKFSINEGGNLGFQIRGGIYIYIYKIRMAQENGIQF